MCPDKVPCNPATYVCSPTSHNPQFVIGAGDVIAATLPNLRSLKKVMVNSINPMPLLQTVGLCRKLEVVVVKSAKHCEVGKRCAYTWFQNVHKACCGTGLLGGGVLHHFPFTRPAANHFQKGTFTRQTKHCSQ